MLKIFLYLYPIEEYTKMLIHDKRCLLILNECLKKRYRNKGYQVVFALYPDKNIFGIIPTKEDKIILTDVTFDEACAYYSNGTPKENFIPKYPNEEFLLNQLGNIHELVIGGYHFKDCVKRVGEIALSKGIKTTIDLDLTDLFFSLYRNDKYFQIDCYNPKRFKEFFWLSFEQQGWDKEFIERRFFNMYGNPVYGFYSEKTFTLKKLLSN